MGNKITLPSKSRESTDELSEKNKKSKGFSEESKPRGQGKQTKSRVTTIARIAGKRWTQMNDEQRKKYVDLANVEKKRREDSKRKRINNHNSKVKKVKSKNRSIQRSS